MRLRACTGRWVFTGDAMLRTRQPLESEELRVSGCSPMAFLVATLGGAGNRGHKGPMRITYGGLVAA